MIDVGETNTPEVAYYESRGGDTTMDVPLNIARKRAEQKARDDTRLASLLRGCYYGPACLNTPEDNVGFLLRLLAAERVRQR